MSGLEVKVFRFFCSARGSSLPNAKATLAAAIIDEIDVLGTPGFSSSSYS
jgi:hypothetical protein